MQTIFETRVDLLPVSVYPTNQDMGFAAAERTKVIMQEAVQSRGIANIILATGNSQLTFLAALSQMPGIAWDKINVFHMDEYVGLDPEHTASFPRFLRQHIIDTVKPRKFFPIPGGATDVAAACQEYENLLRKNPIDLCALGIGENGHLAFNDPPGARFDDPKWVRIVRLTESCKRQQVGEGHFGSIDEVPSEAITLTIPALLAAKQVLAIVPEARKANIVYKTLRESISTLCPASILRQTAHAHLFLDAESGARIIPL
jgi:glucosamine-6-phosphate deaminase